MNKTTIFFLLILLAALSLGGTSAYADQDKDQNEIKPNKFLEIFEMSGEGKNKIQFRIKNNHNDENAEFMIKGVISTSSSTFIIIDGKTINIDSSVTGEIKIVGKLEVGAYAMAKGEIIDSKYYAEKIVVNQRNKKDIEEDKDGDEIVTPSATPTPLLSPTPTPVSTQSASIEESHDKNLDLGKLIERIQNFLNYLKDLASKI